MRNRHWLAGLALAAALMACNTSQDVMTPLPSGLITGTPSEIRTQPSITFTLPVPSTDLPTRTPPPPIARIREELVNCRFGPGTVYEVLNELKEGQFARVAGKNDLGTWYYIHDPGNPGGFCWVSADVVDIEGDASALSVVLPPGPSVTRIDVIVEPDRIIVSCDAFPQTVYMRAEITTDGPALVTYRWEASTGVSSVDNAIAFEGAETKIIQDFYQIGAPNDYWIRMHVLGPNDISEQVNFRVLCN